MFCSRREEPGVATGFGQVVSDNWRAAESQGEGAPIPVQIANQLRGKEFRNFRAFREALWKAVANDVELAKHYGPNSVDRMRKGRAPWAAKNERVGKNMKIELHHKHYISEGGDVYGVDNIGLVTPKAHVNIHRRGGDE